jgi:hypothetical protein
MVPPHGLIAHIKKNRSIDFITLKYLALNRFSTISVKKLVPYLIAYQLPTHPFCYKPTEEAKQHLIVF